ncbi:hypothetical protein ACTXT7_008981 [Hymenolepis weldensis]
MDFVTFDAGNTSLFISEIYYNWNLDSIGFQLHPSGIENLVTAPAREFAGVHLKYLFSVKQILTIFIYATLLNTPSIVRPAFSV